MPLDNCADCPNTCLGYDVASDCVVHDGQSLKPIIDGLLNKPPETVNVNLVTSDDVISKSIIKNTSAVCSSAIVDRTFTYTISNSQTTSSFGWNLNDFIAQLPTNYKVAVVRVRITGSGSGNVIADSRLRSGAVNIGLDQYPATADLLIRITSPCGDIDAETSISLTNPSNTGSYRRTLSVTDLNPAMGSIMLTDQLNTLESSIEVMGSKVDTIPDYTTEFAVQSGQIEALQNQVADPDSYEITYVKNGSHNTDELNLIITDLYTLIKELQTKNAEQDIEIASLQSQIASL